MAAPHQWCSSELGAGAGKRVSLMLIFYHFVHAFGTVLQAVNTFLPLLLMSPEIAVTTLCLRAARSQRKRL